MARGRPSRDTIYTRLQEYAEKMQRHYGGLPDLPQAEEVWGEIWHLDTHHSTAIEGNTLTLKEVQRVTDEGITPSKSLKETLEVLGYADAARHVHRQANNLGQAENRPLLNLQEIRRIHHILMSPVWALYPHRDGTDEEGPGNFRRHEIHPFPGGMQPPSWVIVGTELDAWLERLNTQLTDVQIRDLPEALAKIHCEFERIHPFLDGNGRTGRLILHLLLLRLGLPPTMIEKSKRGKYLKALDAADQGDAGRLGELIARGIIDNIERFVLPVVAQSETLLPLNSLAHRYDISVPALRQAAIRGKLDAHRSGGRWVASPTAVEEYLKNRYRRD